MVDVTAMDGIIPEDNVERLRNIRDMFENTDQTDEQLQLQKVEKLHPSDKIKNIFLNDEIIIRPSSASVNDDDDEDDREDGIKITQTDAYDSLEELSHSDENRDDAPVEEVQQVEAPLSPKQQQAQDDDHLSTRSNSPSNVSSLSSQSTPSYLNDDAANAAGMPRNDSSSFNMHEFENRFEDGVADEETEEGRAAKKMVIVPPLSVELSSVKTKFEGGDAAGEVDTAPRPVRCITPPREDIDNGEIENQPMQRHADIVSATEKTQEILPESGLARSRKEMFQQVASPTTPADKSASRVKSITPPREEINKRVLKEKTPERNENVVREADRNEEVLPSAGSAKQTAAIFASGNSTTLAKSIEKSGITLEGELLEKGIAKSRLELFNNLASAPTTTTGSGAANSEIENISSGVAKERLSVFKNLESQRQSPPKDVKKLKEFTPPPQLDTQQRQYIIIDKEQPNVDNVVKEANKLEEFVPEAGLAKNRMKQYLETATSQQQAATNGEGDVLPEKGSAKSLLAKWKSIENLKEKETSVATEIPTDAENIAQNGIAKNMLKQWQNIDSANGSHERKSMSPGSDKQEDGPQIEKGFAKNVLAKFQQTVAESSTNIKKSVTPPRDLISSSQNARVVYESTPVESNINSQYNNEEEVIPSAGTASKLKSKFQSFEKEAAKIETSSSKLSYVPKRFTSADKPAAKSTANGKAATNGTSASTNGTPIGTSGDKCAGCDKTVYAMEKIEADKKVYHKLCFKCTTCNCTLKLGNFTTISNKLYCTPHYIQLFARNGNYDEGFGLENYKRKWLNKNEQTTVS